MTAYDAASALVTLIATNAATLNANAQLAASGYSVKTDAGTATGDTSPYRYLKIGDRDILADNALTICVVPVGMEPNGEQTCNGVIYEAHCTVMAYLMGTADPYKREQGRAGIAEALRSLLNSIPQRDIATDFHDCRVEPTRFGYSARLGETKMGQMAAGARLEWRGLYYVTEDSSHG